MKVAITVTLMLTTLLIVIRSDQPNPIPSPDPPYADPDALVTSYALWANYIRLNGTGPPFRFHDFLSPEVQCVYVVYEYEGWARPNDLEQARQGLLMVGRRQPNPVPDGHRAVLLSGQSGVQVILRAIDSGFLFSSSEGCVVGSQSIILHVPTVNDQYMLSLTHKEVN